MKDVVLWIRQVKFDQWFWHIADLAFLQSGDLAGLYLDTNCISDFVNLADM